MEFSGHCLSFAFSRNWFLTYIQTWIMANDFIWILSHHINLGTSITATFNYCFCYHYSNDTSLYQWWYEQTFAFYESCSKTRFYYYLLSLLFIYVQHYYYHYHYCVILILNIIIIIHIIIVIMDIIYAYFNVSLYHVISLTLLHQFAFVWLLIDII